MANQAAKKANRMGQAVTGERLEFQSPKPFIHRLSGVHEPQLSGQQPYPVSRWARGFALLDQH
jgi:hypothetical protein